jgi:hypothetical protein
MGKTFDFSMGLILIIVTLVSGSGLVYLTASTGSGVVLFVEPEVTSFELGQVFTLNIGIANVENLFKWTMNLRWDPSIVELDSVSSSAITEGPFLKNVGRTYFQIATYIACSGYLSYVGCELTQPVSASGSGTLLTIRFKAVNKGETTIAIVNSVLHDSCKQEISHTCESGRVLVDSVVHDLAVLLEAPSTLVLGKSTRVNATVTNTGEVDETDVNVAILVNGKAEKSETAPLLETSTSYSVSLLWSPSSSGVYNITAYASPVPRETATNNNVDTLMVGVVSMVHDLAVSLEAPTRLALGESVTLNATVTNVGAYDETSVEASVIIDGVTEESDTFDLMVGSSRRLTLQWQPAQEGTHNITASVRPVAEETSIANNRESTVVNVANPSARSRILIVSDDDGLYYMRGTSLPEFELALRYAGFSYDVWKESVMGRPSIGTLLEYELVIWTCGDSSVRPVNLVDARTLIQYLAEGGNLLIEGQEIAFWAEPSFRSEALHISFIGYISYKPSTGMLVVKEHPLTANLPTNITWSTEPDHTDKVVSSGEAYTVMQYYGEGTPDFSSSNYNTTAVNVFDGVETGSTIYYAFSLFNLPERERQIMVKNCVNWLLRNDISTIGVGLVNAPERSVYFVYPDPVSLTVDDTFGIVAGATVYGLCRFPQEQIFTTNSNWIVSGKIDSAKINDAIVAMFGNPRYHETIRTYEEKGLTPIKLYRNQGHSMLLRSDGSVIVSLSDDDLANGLDDAFVIYTFTEGENEFLVVYGLTWKSTWDAGVFFVDTISKNFQQYAQTAYVARWDSMKSEYQEVPLP